MNEREFCYWLKGYFEIRRAEVGLSDAQVDIIKDHLDLVFAKVTPVRDVIKEEKQVNYPFNPCGTFIGPPPDLNVRSYLCGSPSGHLEYTCQGSC